MSSFMAAIAFSFKGQSSCARAVVPALALAEMSTTANALTCTTVKFAFPTIALLKVSKDCSRQRT